AYTVLKSQKEIIDNYFKFLFKSKAFISELQLSIVGIREGKNISYEELKYSYTPIPTLEEQQTIANFLDDKTAKIDQTIAIKQKEIELLKERRQILIQKAVTKGLDDTVTLKDSGVDWIGDIPEHWEVRKITYLFSKIGSGTTPTSGDLRYYDGVINFLQTGDLNDGYIISTSKTLKEKALRDFTSLKIYPKESLVIAMYGATIGKLGILNIDSATNQACCVLSNPRNVLTKYFFFVLLAFRKEIVSMGYGGGQPNISQDLIKSLRFPIANLNEQIQIVSYLEVIEEKISKAILLKQQEIEKLKEYKTVLIDQVVTGKVKIN
ncbi:MAG TPA: restriction endonuclease subunit S, partial [Chryseobacterium sp.]|nr:restriction endonuclease subunit S [Chryseobacterium sp.]